METKRETNDYSVLTAIVTLLWVSLLITLLLMGQWLAAFCWFASWFFGFAGAVYTGRARNEVL